MNSSEIVSVARDLARDLGPEGLARVFLAGEPYRFGAEPVVECQPGLQGLYMGACIMRTRNREVYDRHVREGLFLRAIRQQLADDPKAARLAKLLGGGRWVRWMSVEQRHEAWFTAFLAIMAEMQGCFGRSEYVADSVYAGLKMGLVAGKLFEEDRVQEGCELGIAALEMDVDVFNWDNVGARVRESFTHRLP